MIKWLKARRLSKLREELAVVEAQIEEEARSERNTGTIYPMVRAHDAGKRARLLYRIKQLESVPQLVRDPAGEAT